MLFKDFKLPLPMVLLLLVLMTLSISVIADESNRFITMTGKGEVSAPPDTAWLNSGVNTQAKTANEAMKENNKLMEKIIDVFKDADIDKKHIQTSGFNVSPLYDYSKNTNPPSLIGYQVTNNVTVKITNINDLGEILDSVVESGSNNVSGIRFGFDDDEKLLDDARKRAIKNARKKANLYADAAGVEVGDVISINETGARLPQPIYHRMEMASAAKMSMSDSSVPINSGEQNISASVTVIYELSD